MATVTIRLDGVGGLPMPEPVLKSVYASGMDFEPDERRMRITRRARWNCRWISVPTAYTPR